MKNTPIKQSIVVFVFVAVAFFGGFLFGSSNRTSAEDTVAPASISSTSLNASTTADFAPFWKTWNLINEYYLPDTGTSTTVKPVTDQERVWGAISGLTRSLGDPYTTFFPPKEQEVFKTEISGNFEGVGMEIALQNDVITVVAPLKNSPAERAGVKPGDKIIKINDQNAIGMSVEEGIHNIRGPKGSTVRITVVREKVKDPIELSITRDVITLPTLETKIYNKDKTPGKDVFVLRLFSFSEISANLFYKAMQEFAAAKTDRLIIDLRGNPGGYLENAVEMASLFIPAGKVVVHESSSKTQGSIDYRSKGYTDFADRLKNAKIAILIDKGSASASEIFAGAMSEHGLATLIGEQSFGKGSVQQLMPVTEKTSVKITVARWFTPNMRSISKSGLTPDIVVTPTEDDIKAKRDVQLEKAAEFLLSK